ncbi:MAG: AAA family ATPase, partial [Polyangiaceae bacterium]|nr:AAA family ATPase [Polyangiaceae bacterium]
MSKNEVTVEGEVLRTTYENANNGFRVVQLDLGRNKRTTIVGKFAPVQAGARIRVRGFSKTDPKYGDQVQAESVTELLPETIRGIEKYLGSGLIPGIGPGFAKRVVDSFELETFSVLDDNPERLHGVPGLGKKRIDALIHGWKEHRALRDVMIFLQAYGATQSIAIRVFRKYGPKAVAIVSADPYRLAIDVPGVGFRTADRIAEGLGISESAPTRIQAGVLQALADSIDEGHTAAPTPYLVDRAVAILPRGSYVPDVADVEHAVDALAVSGLVVRDRWGEDELIVDPKIDEVERRLAQSVAAQLDSGANSKDLPGVNEAIVAFEKSSNVTLAPQQREAILAAAENRFLVITGGPGVGKTTIVKGLLYLFQKAKLSVRLAAPTGRAAKRLSEATQMEAATIHRLLEFDPKSFSFTRNSNDPLEADVIIVDEASMVDVFLADALMAALPISARIVWVGDVDQLPSVGPGAFLSDLLRSRAIPFVRLTQIFRQAHESLITVNAHRIHQGEMPEKAERADQDFFVIEKKDPEEAKAAILEVVCERIPKRFGLDPLRDVQVLVPMHKGILGSLSINEALQARLNPGTTDTPKG